MKALIGKTLQRTPIPGDPDEKYAPFDRLKILDIYGEDEGAARWGEDDTRQYPVEIMYVDYKHGEGTIGILPIDHWRELFILYRWHIVDE